VAVLFADITGFTKLVESADPEIVYQVIGPLLDDLALLVRLHGGEIQQMLGDGFMAVFGLRSQRGDEAGQAVRAALDLVAAVGGGSRRPPVHVGVECGEVLVSPAWEPAGFAVWGRAVNLAKRLCELAGPNTVHVGPGAYHSAGQCLRSATPVQVDLKGVTGTVLAYSVTAGEEIHAALAS
jgi:class 3 adenylate cyclase